MITTKLLNEVHRIAVRLHERNWSSAVSVDQIDDVVQEFVCHYLSAKGFRYALDSCENAAHRKALITPQINRLYSEMCQSERLAANQETYSIESVKDELKGVSTNRRIVDLLPDAMKALDVRHAAYSEALRSRYLDEVIPEQGADAQLLTDAHRAITDEVNRLNRGDWVFRDGPSLKNAVPAEERKGKGATSDPTADMAIAVMSSAEARDVFYGEIPAYGLNVQLIHEPTPNPVWSIFDDDFRDMPGVHSYRASVFPDLYPNERSNWNDSEN